METLSEHNYTTLDPISCISMGTLFPGSPENCFLQCLFKIHRYIVILINYILGIYLNSYMRLLDFFFN